MRMTISAVEGVHLGRGLTGDAGWWKLFGSASNELFRWRRRVAGTLAIILLAGVSVLTAFAQGAAPTRQAKLPTDADPNVMPAPRVVQAQRFLAQRGGARKRDMARPIQVREDAQNVVALTTGSAGTAAWQPLGPNAVVSANYGLVTGRISSIELDPADPTGNSVFVGTTGGGVWHSQNAAKDLDNTTLFDESLRRAIMIDNGLKLFPGLTKTNS